MTTMTPAEAKTIRERLGVPTEYIAERIGVTKGRVWDYESPARRRPLPPAAADVLADMAATFDAAVDQAVAAVRKTGVIPRHTDPEAFAAWVPTLRDWPIGVQGALIAAVQQQTAATVEYR